MTAFLQWIGSWPGAVLLQESWLAYLFVNATHILGIGLLVGAIVPLDLRLIGFFRTAPLDALGPFLVRTAATGIALAALTGLWLFSVKPQEYIDNPAFLTKIALLTLALLNVAIQHQGDHFRLALTGRESVSMRIRVLAALSACLWLSVLVAGRWIGFLWVSGF